MHCRDGKAHPKTNFPANSKKLSCWECDDIYNSWEACKGKLTGVLASSGLVHWYCSFCRIFYVTPLQLKVLGFFLVLTKGVIQCFMKRTKNVFHRASTYRLKLPLQEAPRDRLVRNSGILEKWIQQSVAALGWLIIYYPCTPHSSCACWCETQHWASDSK